MKPIAIILLCIAASVVYGVIHDQVTARICVEYFTIGHPNLFGTDNPTLLGLGWGILATWWVGLMLGIPLSFAARWGKRPKVDVRDLVRPLGVLLLVSGLVALLAGLVGFVAASKGWVWLVEPFASEVPPDRHVAFLVDGFAHTASYLVGFIGGLVLVVRTWRRRLRPLANTLGSSSSNPDRTRTVSKTEKS